VIEPGRRHLAHVAVHVIAIAGLLLVALTGRIAYRTARAFPDYAIWVAHEYEGGGVGDPSVRERLGGVDRAVRRVGWFLTITVGLSLALLVTSHVMLVREISRREHIERALNDANRELESFSYSVSHDLRAPLRSIDGFSQALVEDVGSQLPPDALNHLDRIRHSTRRMGLLIDELMALSKVARVEMKRERIDLSDVADQVVAELRRQQPARDVDITITPGLQATADASLVRLALQNLIENAWKFSSRRDGSTIEVGQTRDANGAPAFFVRDNGAGFDPDYAHKLFGPFQRLHSVAEFPGTGIGLATVQRIVHRHGGRVWAEGRVNSGAIFYFTLG
jgi:light-regulated signal transduction histidine kinase (bacteriophytochrome)